MPVIAGMVFLCDESAFAAKGDYVVLLHGIGRTSSCMAKLGMAFEKEGYQVLNIDYPSRESAIKSHADRVEKEIKSFVTDKNRHIHFVGYSMGGLVARAYIHAYKPKNMGRLVMLGTPNQGSEVADLLEESFLFNWFYGPAGQELTTDYNRSEICGAIDYEAAAIAGTWTIDPISYFIIPGQNDGKVSVSSTKVEGLAAHLVLPVTHTFLPLNDAVIKQTITFVDQGKFLPVE